METVYQTAKTNFNNAIGSIADNRIIIRNGKDSNIIQIDAIKKINLVKKRRFETNLLFMLSGLLTAIVLFYNLNIEMVYKQLVILVIVLSIIMSVFHKSYLYQIIIYLKDEKKLIVKSRKLHKEQLKYFYFSIRKKLPTDSFGK